MLHREVAWGAWAQFTINDGGLPLAQYIQYIILYMCIASCVHVDVVLCAIWYHCYNLKNVKNTHGEVLILVNFSIFQRRALSQTPVNIYKTFWRHPGRLLTSYVRLIYVLCLLGTFITLFLIRSYNDLKTRIYDVAVLLVNKTNHNLPSNKDSNKRSLIILNPLNLAVQ